MYVRTYLTRLYEPYQEGTRLGGDIPMPTGHENR